MSDTRSGDAAPLTAAALDEIERLSKAATPGPYKADEHLVLQPRPDLFPDGDGIIVAHCGGVPFHDPVPQDAAYIAAACNAAPSLAAEVRAAREEIAKLRQAVATATQIMGYVGPAHMQRAMDAFAAARQEPARGSAAEGGDAS